VNPVSIRSRLLVAASLVLILFLGLTGIALDKGFQQSVQTSVRERLQTHVYALLATAELDSQNRLTLPAQLPEPRFASPDSGLYADVTDQQGKALWLSRSLLNSPLPPQIFGSPGEWHYGTISTKTGQRLIVTSFVASWSGSDARNHAFRFRVAEDHRLFAEQIRKFRRSLWSWLGFAAVILLAAQGSILKWSLSPLQKAESEILAIEAGRANRLSTDYPRELTGLTNNLNSLLESSQRHLLRYRDSLGNLAHSLKTPLAVLRNLQHSTATESERQRIADEQVQRMIDIVNHQLQRAATAGRNAPGIRYLVAEPVSKIAQALAKVYASKRVAFNLEGDAQTEFGGDQGDFYELMGNLLDNAYKHCEGRVTVTTRNLESETDQPRICMTIDDDGPGIPESVRASVLQRGLKANADKEGQGLGLAMVADTVQLYGGEIRILDNDWGGTRVEVTL